MDDAKAAGGQAADFVEATMSFVIDTGQKPVSETYGDGSTVHSYHGEYENRIARIHDVREAARGYSLDREGYRLVTHPTKVKDFFDEDEVRAVYYPELVELVKRETGCVRAVVFDHTRRAGDEETREKHKIRGPVSTVHNDYTDWSGPQRVRDILPDEADRLLQHRVQVIQVWRAIAGPILRSPLALCDARTTSPQDFVAAERRFPNRVGEIYHIAFNEKQRWGYVPHMTREEALVFKCYDSRKDVARFTPHGSFDAPATPPGAPPRRSMEARLLTFWAE
ncbi:MAG: CmcJ/NvfI family oxidoreductase [Beijerinckiaceae bacterium]